MGFPRSSSGGSSSLHGREQGDLISFPEDIARPLILDADGDEGRAAQRLQHGKLVRQSLVQLPYRGPLDHWLESVGRAKLSTNTIQY